MEGPGLGDHAGDFGQRFPRVGEVEPLKSYRHVEDRCQVVGQAILQMACAVPRPPPRPIRPDARTAT